MLTIGVVFVDYEIALIAENWWSVEVCRGKEKSALAQIDMN